MIKYCENTLRRRAKKIGFTVEKGYQRYLNEKWGTVKDSNGNRIIGYSLYNPEGIEVNAPFDSTACHDHEMTIEELEFYLQKLYEERGLPW